MHDLRLSGESFLRAGIARPLLLLYAGGWAQAVDEIVQLALGQLELLRGAFDVEEAGAHGDADLIEKADLGEDVVSEAAQAVKASLLRLGAAGAGGELLRVEPLREGEDLVLRAAGERRAIGDAVVIPSLLREPETPDMLHPVEDDAHADFDGLAVKLERPDLRLSHVLVAWHSLPPVG